MMSSKVVRQKLSPFLDDQLRSTQKSCSLHMWDARAFNLSDFSSPAKVCFTMAAQSRTDGQL